MASLDDFIAAWLPIKFEDPRLEEIKQLLLELALRVRQIKELAIHNAVMHDGYMWVRADDLLTILET